MMTDPGPGADQIRADIERTRAEIAQTRADIEQTPAELAETVRALSAELDVKRRELRNAQDARAQSPEAVQHAVARFGQAAKPVVNKMAGDAHRGALVAAGLVVVLVVFWRTRRGT